MKPAEQKTTIEAPTLLSTGEPTSLRELVAAHRAALANATTDDERGRLHLMIGTYLNALGTDSRDEAIEEIRQALVFVTDANSFEQAVTRLQLGGLLQDQAMANAMADRIPAARAAAAEEALYQLKLAHKTLVRAGFVLPRIEATRRYAHALSFHGRFDDMYALLEREQRAHTGEHCRWIELYIVEHALHDPDPKRQAQGAAILAACFSADNGIPRGASEFVMGIVGTTLSRLPKPVVELALAWMEKRDDTPTDLLASLRSRLYPDEPHRWLTKSEQKTFVATMNDTSGSVLKRINAAYHLLSLLPREENVIRRRAADLLEILIDSPELDIVRKMSVRHDLAVAWMMLGKTDAALLERSVRHLEIVLNEAEGTAEYPVVAKNLAQSLVELLEVRSEISSPELIPIALRLAIISQIIPIDKRHNFRLVAAERLMRWSVLTHIACVEMAMKLINAVLDESPNDPTAARLLCKNAWIHHQQGLVEREVFEKLRHKYPAVTDLQLADPELSSKIDLRSVAQALAGRAALHSINLDIVLQFISQRPDAADIVFNEAQRRLNAGSQAAKTVQKLLDSAIQAVIIAPSGDENDRGQKLALLFLKCEKSLGRPEIVRRARMVRCPATQSLYETLGKHGITITSSTEDVDASLSPMDQAGDLQARGIDLMHEGRRHLANLDDVAAARAFENACTALDRSLEIATVLPDARRAMIQISAGNARKLLARVDSNRALVLLAEADALYVKAWPLTEKQPQLRAQLAKVRADGLILMKKDSLWGDAMRLYKIALEGRPTGFLRWETLWSAAEAELVCPKRARTINLIAAMSRLDEASKFIGANNQEEIEKQRLTARHMLEFLQELANGGALSPEERQRIAKRIAKIAPEYEDDARLAARGLVSGAIGGMAADSLKSDTWSSAYMQTVVKATRLLHMPSSLDALPPNMREPVKKAVESGKMELGSQGAKNEIDLLHAQAERLRHPEHNENAQQRAGRLVGRAMILSRLEELDVDVLHERRAASIEAEQAVYAIEDASIQGAALASVSGTWQHMGPGGDFPRAARISQEALNLIPEDRTHARADATNGFARATRYRTDIAQHQALEMAIPAYQQAVELYRKSGDADGMVMVLKNLAEAVGARQDRPRAVALRESLAIEREAIPLARTSRSGHLAGILGNHAYALTLLAQAPDVPSDERQRCLDEAKPLFEEALRICTDAPLRKHIENNHLIWRTACSRGADRGALISDLRARLRQFDPKTQPHDWSMAAHNLADELFECHQSIAELQEAQEIFERALELRPESAGPKYHWETAQRLGELYGLLYNQRGRIDLRPFRMSPGAARDRALQHVHSAMNAARLLGPGHRLTRSARYLGLIAADVSPGDMPDLTIADEALLALDEVLSLMPEARDAGEVEAEVAEAIAASLALHRAKTAVVQAITSTGATALHGSAAWEVLHWMLRAHGGQHRRLRARMTKPNGVSPERWTRWRQALRNQNNWDERRKAFQAVQEECGSFLSGEPDLSATLDWMKSSGGSAAILLETSRGRLLGVLTPGDQGVVIAWVVLLKASSPPFSLNEFLTLTRSPVTGGGSDEAIAKARKALDDAVKWLRSNVLPDLRERIPTNTPVLLWSPHGLAAGVPLGIAWNDLPSVWTTPCLTRPPPSIAKDVRQSTLLVLAEPADVPPIIDGAATMARIAQGICDSGGRVQALFGKGRTTGPAIAGMHDVPGLVDVAPTPNEVKRRLPDHRIIVILAHGQYNDAVPDKSALALIGPNGQMELLTAEALAETPDLLRGAVVVLLSCETGAAGELSAAPAGLAGVLLTVGAAAVVAPLWIVLQRVALNVGEQLVADIAYSYDLGKAVQWAQDRARKGTDPFRDGPFVLWTG